MLIKNIKALAAVALVLLGASASTFASHTVYVQETFGSGAAFNGSLMFSDDYQALLSGTGSLTGVTNGPITLNNTYYGHLSEVPVTGTLGNDWLLDGPASGTFGTDYHYFLGFVWKLSGGDLILLHDDSVTPFLSGLSSDVHPDYSDPILTAVVSLDPPAPPTTNPVPEPASALLLGAGIAALVGMRRRKAA